MLKVCEQRRREGLPIYLYGSRREVVETLAARLEARFPGLRVAGTRPSRFRQLHAGRKAGNRREIRDSGAAICFVGLGCPRQETWVYEYRDGAGHARLAVGAAFDFHAGAAAAGTAAAAARRLEWLFRLVKSRSACGSATCCSTRSTSGCFFFRRPACAPFPRRRPRRPVRRGGMVECGARPWPCDGGQCGHGDSPAPASAPPARPARRERVRLAGARCAVALAQGLLYLFLLPPWQHYDEPTHFEYACAVRTVGAAPRRGRDGPHPAARDRGFHGRVEFLLESSAPRPAEQRSTKINIGINELHHPPVYYALLSVPLRLGQPPRHFHPTVRGALGLAAPLCASPC